MTELREYVKKLRAEAQDRLRADRPRLFSHVPDEEFEGILNALGDISIFEARLALARIEKEKQS